MDHGNLSWRVRCAAPGLLVGWGRGAQLQPGPPREQPSGRSAEEPGTFGLGRAQCSFRVCAERESRCLTESGVTESDVKLEISTNDRGWWVGGGALLEHLKTDYARTSGQVPMVEVKAYRQMALLSSAFAFRWSKWNMACNSTRVVFRVQYAN